MKKKLNVLLLLVCLALISCSSEKAFEISDLIKTVNLESGIEKEIIVSDLFYADHYDLKFNTNENIEVGYNKNEKLLSLKADKNFEGMTSISFMKDGKTYSFPVNCVKRPTIKFTFEPSKNYKKINLFGSFNDWNRQELEMKDENKDGIYEIEVALDAGNYEYKFFADGEELLDPANSEKRANGLGGFNSILNVQPRFDFDSFLHIRDFEETDNSLNYEFLFERTDGQNEITKENVFTFLNNKLVQDISVNGNLITVSLDKSEFNDIDHLRIAVSKEGQTSNIQDILLNNGKPNADKFTWFDGVIYSLMIDRFNDGNKELNNPIDNDSVNPKANYNGGDFQGVIDKLNEGYFDKLGVNIIWMSPVYDNPNKAYQEYPEPHRWFSGYHGYWPIDPQRVEEKFGSFEKLKELVDLAHKHDIKILLDFVSNHVHKEHPYFKEHRDWFGKLELPDGRLNLRFWDEYRLTTWFEPYLPSFDYVGSDEAVEAMTDNAIWWLKQTNADGFRHDAVKHVPNKFWRRLTEKINQKIEVPMKRNVYQVGETFGSYDLTSSYVNNGQLSAQFNFNLYNVAQTAFINENADFSMLAEDMKRTFKYYGPLHEMANIMDSHDKNRYMAYTDGDLDLSQWSAVEIGWNNPPKVDDPVSYKKAELYLAYMNTIPGLPVIYYGSEFGMTGASDPDNRRMMRFGDDLNKYEKEMLKNTRKMINIRNDHPALRYGDFYTVQTDQSIFAYVRSYLNERILVVINKSKDSRNLSVKLPEFYGTGQLTDLVKGDKINLNSDKLEVTGISWNIYKIN